MTYLAWPAARFEEFRRDVEGNFLRSLDQCGLGERIRAGQRAERFRTAPDLPAWFRTAIRPRLGPGRRRRPAHGPDHRPGHQRRIP